MPKVLIAPMTLANLGAGAAVFLDANTFVYYFQPHPKYGALIVALLNHAGLTNIASSDGDFDRVPGLTRYGPV